MFVVVVMVPCECVAVPPGLPKKEPLRSSSDSSVRGTRRCSFEDGRGDMWTSPVRFHFLVRATALSIRTRPSLAKGVPKLKILVSCVGFFLVLEFQENKLLEFQEKRSFSGNPEENAFGFQGVEGIQRLGESSSSYWQEHSVEFLENVCVAPAFDNGRVWFRVEP